MLFIVIAGQWPDHPPREQLEALEWERVEAQERCATRLGAKIPLSDGEVWVDAPEIARSLEVTRRGCEARNHTPAPEGLEGAGKSMVCLVPAIA